MIWSRTGRTRRARQPDCCLLNLAPVLAGRGRREAPGEGTLHAHLSFRICGNSPSPHPLPAKGGAREHTSVAARPAINPPPTAACSRPHTIVRGGSPLPHVS